MVAACMERGLDVSGRPTRPQLLARWRADVAGVAAVPTTTRSAMVALINAAYNSTTPLPPPEEQCPICMEEWASMKGDNLKGYLQPCGHAVCRTCWHRLLNQNADCPLCRGEIWLCTFADGVW